MRQTAWKKLIEPPSKIEFNTTIKAPNQGSVNAAAKIAAEGMYALVFKIVQALKTHEATQQAVSVTEVFGSNLTPLKWN